MTLKNKAGKVSDKPTVSLNILQNLVSANVEAVGCCCDQRGNEVVLRYKCISRFLLCLIKLLEITGLISHIDQLCGN